MISLLRPALLVVFFSVSALRAADPAPGEAMLELRACFVRATEAQYAEAMKTESGSPEGVIAKEQAGKALAALQNAGARVLADLRTVTLSGQETIAQSIRELRYPTEWDRSESGKSFPTGFETRNVGIQLMATPEVGPDGKIKLNVHPEVTDFLGFIDYVGKDNPATTGQSFDKRLDAPLSSGGVWQPIFHSVSLQSVASLASGQTLILGGAPAASTSSKEGGKPQELIYVFITATLLK